MNYEQSMELVKKYNKQAFHLVHSVTVSEVMRWFAIDLGYADCSDYWATVGLLHDVDYEMYPDEHCKVAPRLLAEIDAPEDVVHAVCSHAYGMCSDVKPEHQMEKVLFAVDELTGLIGAAIKMRPSHSCKDMELSSLKKKFKDKAFAAGCNRNVIRTGAEQLDWEMDTLLDKTLRAMQASEDKINAFAATL